MHMDMWDVRTKTIIQSVQKQNIKFKYFFIVCNADKSITRPNYFIYTYVYSFAINSSTKKFIGDKTFREIVIMKR